MSKKTKLIIQLIGFIIAAYGVITLIGTDSSGDAATYFTIAFGFIILLVARFMKTK